MKRNTNSCKPRKTWRTVVWPLNCSLEWNSKSQTEVEDSVAIVVTDDASLWSDSGSVRPELKIAMEQIKIAESEKS